jgi:hypothetical protein
MEEFLAASPDEATQSALIDDLNKYHELSRTLRGCFGECSLG